MNNFLQCDDSGRYNVRFSCDKKVSGKWQNEVLRKDQSWNMNGIFIVLSTLCY